MDIGQIREDFMENSVCPWVKEEMWDLRDAVGPRCMARQIAALFLGGTYFNLPCSCAVTLQLQSSLTG